jgi:hypothetical protein
VFVVADGAAQDASTSSKLRTCSRSRASMACTASSGHAIHVYQVPVAVRATQRIWVHAVLSVTCDQFTESCSPAPQLARACVRCTMAACWIGQPGARRVTHNLNH